MDHLTEPLIKQLKQARVAKALSQRDLSQATDLPQSYLSRIENGGIDIGLSNLITLARALDLELKLVPKAVVPAVDGLVRSAQPPLASPHPSLPPARYMELANALAKIDRPTERQTKMDADREMLIKALTPLNATNKPHRAFNLDEDRDE